MSNQNKAEYSIVDEEKFLFPKKKKYIWRRKIHPPLRSFHFDSSTCSTNIVFQPFDFTGSCYYGELPTELKIRQKHFYLVIRVSKSWYTHAYRSDFHRCEDVVYSYDSLLCSSQKFAVLSERKDLLRTHMMVNNYCSTIESTCVKHSSKIYSSSSDGFGLYNVKEIQICTMRVLKNTNETVRHGKSPCLLCHLCQNNNSFSVFKYFSQSA